MGVQDAVTPTFKARQMTNLQMKSLEYILEQLRLHGLSFLLMGVAVWYLHSRDVELRNEVKLCNQSMIDMYRIERKELRKVIEANTIALQKIGEDHGY